MIIDVTGIELIPGKRGKRCPGGGNCKDGNQEVIICCNECDYLVCCTSRCYWAYCWVCNDILCPYSWNNKKIKKFLKNLLTKGLIRVKMVKLSFVRESQSESNDV